MPDIKMLIMAVTCCYDSNDLSAPFTFKCTFLNFWKCMNLPIVFFCPLKIFINFLLCTRQLCHNRMISSRKTYIHSVWDDVLLNKQTRMTWCRVICGSSFTWWSEEFSWKATRIWSDFFWDWDFGAFWLWEFLIRGVYLMNYRQVF